MKLTTLVLLLVILSSFSQTTTSNKETIKPLTKTETASKRGRVLLAAPKHVSLYLNSIWNDAEVVSKEVSIPLALVLAASCLESGYGSSNLCKENNHHGIKYNGKYAKFNSQSESFKAYGMVLSQKCYKATECHSLEDWLAALEFCGYAESKKYNKKLLSIIKKYKLNEE